MASRLRPSSFLRRHTRKGAKREGEVAPAPPSPASPLDEARRSAADLASFFRSLGSPDRWAAGASAALLLALALPWRWSPDEDDVIGLVAAWPAGVLAATVIALVYVRARRADSAMSRRLQTGQVVAAFLAMALAAGFVLWASRPLTGSYLGLACATAALVASLPARIRRER